MPKEASALPPNKPPMRRRDSRRDISPKASDLAWASNERSMQPLLAPRCRQQARVRGPIEIVWRRRYWASQPIFGKTKFLSRVRRLLEPSSLGISRRLTAASPSSQTYGRLFLIARLALASVSPSPPREVRRPEGLAPGGHRLPPAQCGRPRFGVGLGPIEWLLCYGLEGARPSRQRTGGRCTPRARGVR